MNRIETCGRAGQMILKRLAACTDCEQARGSGPYRCRPRVSPTSREGCRRLREHPPLSFWRAWASLLCVRIPSVRGCNSLMWPPSYASSSVELQWNNPSLPPTMLSVRSGIVTKPWIVDFLAEGKAE